MASYDGEDDSGRRRPPPQQHRPSGGGSGDLAASAKLVAEAAKAALQDHNLGKVDKGRTAEAAADLLHAASLYGKLEGKPVGGYLNKAEDYLHKFGAKEGGSGGGKHQPSGHGGSGGRYEEEDEYRKQPTSGRGRYEQDDDY